MNAINHSYPEMRPSYPGIRLPHPLIVFLLELVGLTRRQLKLIDHVDRTGTQLNRLVKQIERTLQDVSLERTVGDDLIQTVRDLAEVAGRNPSGMATS